MFKEIQITQASNGFVVTINGDMYVAGTLAEVARLAGEILPSDSFTTYVPGYTSESLQKVRTLREEGRKIDAIKLLRDCFHPRLGLREAKELVEHL